MNSGVDQKVGVEDLRKFLEGKESHMLSVDLFGYLDQTTKDRLGRVQWRYGQSPGFSYNQDLKGVESKMPITNPQTRKPYLEISFVASTKNVQRITDPFSQLGNPV